MITLENVIEEMVGPIEDEFDAETPLVLKKGEGRFEVDASCPLDEFGDEVWSGRTGEDACRHRGRDAERGAAPHCPRRRRTGRGAAQDHGDRI